MAKLKKAETALMLRTCNADMSSSHGFVWPESGPVSCDDWEPTPKCGHGLHGLLWGVGKAGLLSEEESAKWLVVEVDVASVVEVTEQGGGKVKVPAGVVVFCGARDEAIAYLDAHGGAAHPGVFTTRTAGDAGTATAGTRGTATAGTRGTATAGYAGTATAGDAGTATAGTRGTATAGEEGLLVITRWDGKAYRRAMAIVGQDGIEPNVAYKLNKAGLFVPAEVRAPAEVAK